jgi:hypothetical protein
MVLKWHRTGCLPCYAFFLSELLLPSSFDLSLPLAMSCAFLPNATTILLLKMPALASSSSRFY